MADRGCQRCGADLGPDVPPRPERCGQCPPQPCADCGAPDNAPCFCYLHIDQLPLADLKGLLALDNISLVIEDTP